MKLNYNATRLECLSPIAIVSFLLSDYAIYISSVRDSRSPTQPEKPTIKNLSPVGWITSSLFKLNLGTVSETVNGHHQFLFDHKQLSELETAEVDDKVCENRKVQRFFDAEPVSCGAVVPVSSDEK